MPTSPLLDYMIEGRADRRRVRHLKWSIKRAKAKYHTLRQGPRAYLCAPLPAPVLVTGQQRTPRQARKRSARPNVSLQVDIAGLIGS